MTEPEKPRIPIFLDPVDRTLVDPTSEIADPREWHPMNPAADRLIKCREALHDIQEILESHSLAKAISKKRRRLRAIFVPLHSLCVKLVELLNQIQSDTRLHDRFPPGATSTITTLRSHFERLVPFRHKGKLALLRNRLSAHYESAISPAEMRDLLNSTDSTEIGEWLHIALGVLCDAMKLDAFMWSAEGPEKDTITIMCQEPIISVFRIENSRIVGIVGFYLRKLSPKWMVFDQIRKVAESSQCLFERESRYRIAGFYEDSKGQWARSIQQH